jgi:hypothetical protein
MNKSRFTLSIVAMIAMAYGQTANAADKDCAAEYKKVTAAVTAAPEKVLEVVAKEAQEAPTCACEIVKAAIKAAKADKDLIVQIVTTISAVLPDETPTIITCAINAAPEALQGEVARAIADKFGSGKGVVDSGKEPVSSGKEVVDKGGQKVIEDEDSLDFNLFHSGIGGIYLTTPSGGLSPGAGLPPVIVD